MKKLLGEIHGRSLWQVLGLYLAGSWIALQVVETLTESASLPDWVPALALVMLVIGFPIVMATAFVQHGGPGLAPPAPETGADPATEAAPVATEPTAAVAAAAAEPAPAAATAAPTEPAAHHRLFTWRNAISGGVLAFALVGLLAAGWLITRSMGIGPAATLVAKGVLEDRAPVLVADFESTADQGDLGHTATLALRTDLSQSQVITIVEPTQVADVLQRMPSSRGKSRRPEVPSSCRHAWWTPFPARCFYQAGSAPTTRARSSTRSTSSQSTCGSASENPSAHCVRSRRWQS
jgi:hypothetical protein